LRQALRTLTLLALLVAIAALILPRAWRRVFPAPDATDRAEERVSPDGAALGAVNGAVAEALAALGVSPARIVEAEEDQRQRDEVVWTHTRTTVDLPTFRPEVDLQRAFERWPEHAEAFVTRVDELTWSVRVYVGSYPVHQLVLRQPLDPEPRCATGTPPRLAIVVVDVGERSAEVERVLTLQMPLTVAVRPYHSHSLRYATDAARAAMEVAVHLDPDPIRAETLEEDLDAVPYASGVVLAQAGRGGEEHGVMDQLVQRMGARGLFLLDDQPIQRGVALQVAHSHGLAARSCTERLDGTATPAQRDYATLRLRNLAALRGQAILTVQLGELGAELLIDFIADRRAEGYRLVFASELMAEHGP
jgi:polysaccharide deacetylase 2 family uncharacterized protein YibQ